MDNRSFIDVAIEWFQSLPEDDAEKLMRGISLPAMLILFKHFPANELVKEFLKSKI